MKYQIKPAEVEAFQFNGTEECAHFLKDWASAADVTDVELTWQGIPGKPLALDLTTAAGISTLEADDWLVLKEGRLYMESAGSFAANYEEAGK